MEAYLDILIVDDDPNMTHTLCDILEVSGFVCATATDAREGLERMKQKPCQVVLTVTEPGISE